MSRFVFTNVFGNVNLQCNLSTSNSGRDIPENVHAQGNLSQHRRYSLNEKPIYCHITNLFLGYGGKGLIIDSCTGDNMVGLIYLLYCVYFQSCHIFVYIPCLHNENSCRGCVKNQDVCGVDTSFNIFDHPTMLISS